MDNDDKQWKARQSAPYGRCPCGMPLQFWDREFEFTECAECRSGLTREEAGS